MKFLKILGCLTLALMALDFSRAAAAGNVDGVTVKGGEIFAIKGEQQELLTDNLAFADKIEVSTNGTFKVGNGKERKLGEGQILRSDGWLLDPNGSAAPAIDHVAVKAGRVYVVRDGETSALSEVKHFPNGMSLGPDGSGSYLPGNLSRAGDGELFHLDGSIIPAKDTISLIGGRVVIQKDGSLVTLPAGQIFGMSDGTRVRGTGRVEKRDGSVIQLREGQTILVEGALVRR